MAVAREFVAATPGSWTRSTLDIRASTHEAAHGVVAVLLRIPVAEVRLDRPEEGLLGITRSSAILSREGLRRQLGAVIAPWLVEGTPLPWPPEVGGSGDEHAAAVLSGVLDLDLRGWLGVESATRQLLRLPSTRRALSAVARVLLERGAVSGEELRSLCA